MQHATHERPQVCSTQDEGLQEFGGLPNTDFYFLPSVCSFHLFLECKLCKRRKKKIEAHCCCVFFPFPLARRSKGSFYHFYVHICTQKLVFPVSISLCVAGCFVWNENAKAKCCIKSVIICNFFIEVFMKQDTLFCSLKSGSIRAPCINKTSSVSRRESGVSAAFQQRVSRLGKDCATDK